jgi:hypothetical protein
VEGLVGRRGRHDAGIAVRNVVRYVAAIRVVGAVLGVKHVSPWIAKLPGE